MEEKNGEETVDSQENNIEKKPKNKIESVTDWVLLGLIVISVMTAGIWLGLNAEKQFGGAIQQKFFKTQIIVPDTTPTPTDRDNVIVYQSQKAELLGGLFTYPGSKVELRKQDVDKINLTLSSSDPADMVVKYYRDLVDLNNWKTVRVGGDTSVIKVAQSDFSALVEVDIVDGTTNIKADIDYPDPETMTSTFKSLTKVEEVTVTTPTDQDVIKVDYILPFSGTRIVNNDDLTGLTPWELKVARNEIYARYGRSFVHKDLSCYFAKQSWYSMDPDYSDDSLSEIDVKNASTILNFEKSINSPLVSKDSGCK